MHTRFGNILEIHRNVPGSKMKLKSQMTQSAMILRNSPSASKMGSKERKVDEEKDKEMNS